MKSTRLAACALVVLLSGCTGDPSDSSDSEPESSKPATEITDSGVYEVGVDVAPGVYLSSRPGCVGFTARTRSFDLMDDDLDPDAHFTAAAQVGEVMRIELHDGEFFTSHGCPEWKREDPGQATTPDPATKAGACRILMGDDDLVVQVLAVAGLAPDQREDGDLDVMQEQLMAVVFSHTPKLWAPAGELIDFLDDPGLYVGRDGTLKEHVAQAAADIERICTP